MKATDLNISVLGQCAQGRRVFPNQIDATSAPHMRRCLKLGLVEVVDRATLRLTDAGIAAINDSIARYPTVSRYPEVRS